MIHSQKLIIVTQFEEIIPEIIKELSPEIFLLAVVRPSSGGGFNNSSSNHAGDMHYWDVWHNFKPIEAFRQTLIIVFVRNMALNLFRQLKL